MECYSRYKKDHEVKGERVPGCSTSIKLKSANIKKRSKNLYKECLHDTCSNYGLRDDGVYYTKVKSIVHGFTTFAIQSVCALSTTPSEGEKPSLTMFKRDYVSRKCPHSGIKLVKDIVTNKSHEITYETEVIYEQSKNVEVSNIKTGKVAKRFHSVIEVAPLLQMLDKYYEEVDKMAKHLFHFKWQGEQFEKKMSQNMRAREAMVFIDFDFGMNITYKMELGTINSSSYGNLLPMPKEKL